MKVVIFNHRLSLGLIILSYVPGYVLLFVAFHYY